MAATPPTAPSPAADDDEDQTAGAAQDTGADDEGDESDGQPRVLLTVLCNPDGSYTVIKGDEDDEGGDESGSGDESDDEGAAGEQSESGEDEDDEGDGSDEGEGEPEEGEEGGAEQGETYHSVGQALKAILDIFREDEAQQGGGNDDFSAGYKGESAEGAEGEEPSTVKYQGR